MDYETQLIDHQADDDPAQIQAMAEAIDERVHELEFCLDRLQLQLKDLRVADEPFIEVCTQVAVGAVVVVSLQRLRQKLDHLLDHCPEQHECSRCGGGRCQKKGAL